jgi:D-lactate dehydrogenase (cytochrome)
LEYFDFNSLNLLRKQKEKQGNSSVIPAIPSQAHTAVYIEYGISEDELEDIAEKLMMLMEQYGSDSDIAWTAFDAEEMERLKEFRHAVPEAVNQIIARRARKYPGLTKLGTDFAVKDCDLIKLVELYHTLLNKSGLDYVMFGHIGNNHLHVNIIPADMEEYKKGKAICLDIAGFVVSWGGTVSGEHGIGKIKKDLLSLMFGSKGIEQMRAVKKVFDCKFLLNKGNMF